MLSIQEKRDIRKKEKKLRKEKRKYTIEKNKKLQKKTINYAKIQRTHQKYCEKVKRIDKEMIMIENRFLDILNENWLQ